jgi:hypothetical protein
VIDAGVKWLVDRQEPSGSYGPLEVPHHVYGHAIATLAVVEAFGLTGRGRLRASAQKALDFVAASRNPDGAWRYGFRDGGNDTSVTSWMAFALLSARMVNASEAANGRPEPFRLDKDALTGARAWILRMTDQATGRVGYMVTGTGPARSADDVDRFPPDLSESMTAAGLFVRILLGEDPAKAPDLRKGVALCLRPASARDAGTLPAWTPAGTIDVYYWHYGSLAMYQAGGGAWATWSRALVSAALAGQNTKGDSAALRGSWDPVDPWARDGGRIYSTAMMILSLQSPSRYERVLP